MVDQVPDQEAVSDTLQALDSALRGFFARRVSAEAVEDLVQETYLRVSRGLSALEDHERLAGWVFSIARNLVVDHMRSKKRQAAAGAIVEFDEGQIADSREEEQDLSLEVGRWMAPLITQLPDHYAEVLRESEINEIPHKQIAERLGISVSGVKSRVQRGRALLRDKLNACCLLRFDRRGGIREVERRGGNDPDCCGPKDCCD